MFSIPMRPSEMQQNWLLKAKNIWSRHMKEITGSNEISGTLIEQLEAVSGLKLEIKLEAQGRDSVIYDKELFKEIGRVSRHEMKGRAYTACMEGIKPDMAEPEKEPELETFPNQTGIQAVQIKGNEFIAAGPMYIDLAHIRAILGNRFWIDGCDEIFEAADGCERLLEIWLEYKRKRFWRGEAFKK